MAHVGIQCLGTGQRQHHRPQNGHAHPRVHHEEVDRPAGVEGLEHFRALRNAVHAQCTEHHEPGDHDRAEQLADLLGTVLLHQEQGHQHHQRNRHHPVVDTVERQAHALYRRQHRHRRGDHAVTIEQRSADQATDHHQCAQPRVGRRSPPRQRSQGHGAALALVVGAQDEHHVLERHHPQQRPEDQRQDPQYAVMVDRHPITTGKDFLQGIQRAGADIAINHPDRCHEQAQRPRRTLLTLVPALSVTACLNHRPLPQTAITAFQYSLCDQALTAAWRNGAKHSAAFVVFLLVKRPCAR